MSFDCSLANLTDEIDRSKEMMEPKLQQRLAMIREYETSIEDGAEGGKRCPDNPAYEYIGLFVPSVAHENPRVIAKSRRPMLTGEDARILGYATTDLCIDTDYRTHTQRCAYDMAFLFGASLTIQAGQPGYGGMEDARRPRVEYVGPGRFLIDPSAYHWLCGRWTASARYWDIDTLRDLAREGKGGWNAEMVEAIAEDMDVDATRQREGTDRDTPTRKEVVVWSMHVPEHQLDDEPGPDEGFNGTVFSIVSSMGNTGKAKDMKAWVRAPRPFFGPRWGPHTVYGAYWVPGSPIPLSPLMATRQQALEQQAHARALSKGAMDYKRCVFVDKNNTDLVEQLKNSPHDLVMPCDMPKDTDVLAVEIGGVTDQMLKHYGLTRERFDRMLAMHDAQRGVVTGDGTARENMIAAESTSARVSFLKKQHANAAKRETTNLAWYLKNDDRSRQMVRPGRDRGQAAMGGLWKGGKDENERRIDAKLRENKQPVTSFDDLDIDIAPRSMEFTSEAVAQQQAMQRIQLIGAVAPMIQAFPFVRWQDELASIGDAFNDPNLAESIDFEMAAQMGAMVAPQVGAQPMKMPQQPGGGGQMRVGPAIAGSLPPGPGGNMPGRARPGAPSPMQQPARAAMAGAGRA